MSSREATMNVPCTGKFRIAVLDPDEWIVVLEHNDGKHYIRVNASTVDGGVFFDEYDIFSTITLPEWMWESIVDKIRELTIALERDSIVTPKQEHTYAH